MRKADWINLGLLLAAIVSGIAYLGHLHGRVTALDLDKISEAAAAVETARDDAIDKITSSGPPAMLVEKKYEWRQGKPEVQMIRVAEGFCYLVYFQGKYEGHAEAVSIVPKGDHWFLGGKSNQEHVGADARCWRWNTS